MGKKKNNSSSEGSGAVFAVLLVLFVVVKFFWWIVGAAVAVGLFHLMRALIRDARRRRAIYAQQCAQVVARADQQHNWVMQGDDRGIYGVDGAKIMRAIRADRPPL